MGSRITQPQLTWAQLNAVNPWLFPSVLELAKDRGPIGFILRQIPDELLRDADRCPNSLEDLASMRMMSNGYKQVFRACASVRQAAIKLARKVYSRGDMIERAKRANSMTDSENVVRGLFPGMWRAGASLLRDATVEAGPDIVREFDEREARLLTMILKKNGKAAAAMRPDKPNAAVLRAKHPLEYLLLTRHLRCSHVGDPGLMFFSDPALADLFSLLDWNGLDVRAYDFDSEQVERMRERLGLRKANEKFPYITAVRMNPVTNVIELNTNDAKVAKSEWPKPPIRFRCGIKLGGHVLYAGILS